MLHKWPTQLQYSSKVALFILSEWHFANFLILLIDALFHV